MKSTPCFSFPRRDEIVAVRLLAVLPNGETRPAQVRGACLDHPMLYVEGFGGVECNWRTADMMARVRRFPFDPAQA